MKHIARILALFLVMVTSFGCRDDWKSDSCHIIQTEIQSAPTPSEPTYHWLAAFKALHSAAAATPPLAMEPSPESNTHVPQHTQQPNARQKKTQPEPGSCVDLNLADEKLLATLPGIGAGRAQKIIQIREKRPFKRKSDITRIKGIGRKSYQKMAAYICDIP